MAVTYRPPAEHHCAPGWESRPCTGAAWAPGSDGCPISGPHDHLHHVGAFEAPGTIWRCDCGRTFVGYTLRAVPGGRVDLTTHWRPERRWARWRRERRERRERRGDRRERHAHRHPPAIHNR